MGPTAKYPVLENATVHLEGGTTVGPAKVLRRPHWVVIDVGGNRRDVPRERVAEIVPEGPRQ